jgi:CubicO group peptidase (beta-lactamase class C family)
MSVQGHCDPAFEAVRSAFAAGFDKDEELGAGVAVYAGDRLVVDLWGGIADRKTSRPWLHDTPCLAFSCTKAVTATAALLLAERGLYDLEGPVADWWPGFRAPGATPAHLLSHQAGLPAFDREVSPAEANDPAAMAALLAGQEPVWKPGEAHGYHALTFGWLAGEIVRHFSGVPVGEFVAAEISPDLNIGASDEVIGRAARLSAGRRLSKGTEGSSGEATKNGVAKPRLPADPEDPLAKLLTATVTPGSLTNRAFENPRITSVPGGNNNPVMLAAGWPAMGMVTTATALAGVYRELIAGRILAPETLRNAIERRVEGPDRVMFVDSSFGLGFMRPSMVFLTPRAGWDSAFGHTGLGGSVGLADLDHDFSMAYIPNRMGDQISGGLRAYRLIEAVYNSLP